MSLRTTPADSSLLSLGKLNSCSFIDCKKRKTTSKKVITRGNSFSSLSPPSSSSRLTKRRLVRPLFILAVSIFQIVLFSCYYSNLQLCSLIRFNKRLRGGRETDSTTAASLASSTDVGGDEISGDPSQENLPATTTKRLETGNIKEENSRRSSWVAKHPWEAPPDGFFGHHDTGSFQNCSSRSSLSTSGSGNRISNNNSSTLSKGEGSIVISCQLIHFKAPVDEIKNSGPFIIGILSGASGLGPGRRRVIRKTWASLGSNARNHTTSECHQRDDKEEKEGVMQRNPCHKESPAVFFIVAGPWEEIQEEFETYNDLIWIDEKEVYNGENSVLTQKSFSFFTIAHLLAYSVNHGGWRHAIKADDDCYVNMKWIQEKLSFPHGEYHKLHYYGNCENRGHRPLREPGNKFSANYQMYPEPEFPTFCLGAGYGVSRMFVQSAVENNHISNIRRMAFEDVSMGMLAERMDHPAFTPTTVNYVRNFRGNSKELNDLEKKCIQNGLPVSKCFEDKKWIGWWPPQLDLKDVMVQHRVDLEDMVNIHKSFGYIVADK